MVYWIIVTLLAGLVVGSFLNVLIFRADELKSVLNTRSRCPHCQKTIKWYDLIPIISYILLKGKCRACKKDISIQYPLVEGSTALIFMAIYLAYGLSWQTFFYLVIFSLLIVIFVYDLKTQYILDIFSWPVLILCLAFGWYFATLSASQVILGIVTGAGVLAVLVVVSKEKWMGVGDIIIGAAIGALLGYPRSVVFLFSSFVLGSIFGLILIGMKKKGIKDAVPFAPFMISAAFIALIWGSKIVDWYVGTIFLY